MAIKKKSTKSKNVMTKRQSKKPKADKKPKKQLVEKVSENNVFKLRIPEQKVEIMIAEIAGDDAVKIYKILKGRVDVNEFEIAEKLKAPINYIRNIIYKFEQNNLITSNRKKDRKKGWYIYFYTFSSRDAENLVVKIKRKKVSIYKIQLEREHLHDFYVCPSRCSRFTLENTMEHNFLCPECGSLMVPEDKEKTISRMKNVIFELEGELKVLENLVGNKLEANVSG